MYWLSGSEDGVLPGTWSAPLVMFLRSVVVTMVESRRLFLPYTSRKPPQWSHAHSWQERLGLMRRENRRKDNLRKERGRDTVSVYNF